MSASILGFPLYQLLGMAALSLTGATIAYGSYVAVSLPKEEAAANQAAANEQYVLEYADGEKALFRTPDGLTLVTVGSTLATAGRVQSIEKHAQRWVVRTSKDLYFAKN